ncbi:MAG: 3'(2'),5'-bisphosphate nucleotidase CysQ [Nannocystaceae bacterium]
MTRPSLFLAAIDAALCAGDEILEVYNSAFTVEHKADRTPLTRADTRAHRAIVEALQRTCLPVLSEEGRAIDYQTRRNWTDFWMVDPLDGTKEFVKRNGEFTVNIALIHNGDPVAGVIWVPVTKTLYFATEDVGAHRIYDPSPSPPSDLQAWLRHSTPLPCEPARSQYVAVASRSHTSAETEAFLADLRSQHQCVHTRSVGSSLKICLVAEGAADVYPRFSPTMEWDTAAGQAIAQGAGKRVIDQETGSPMRYNKPSLRNPWFIVS